MGNLQAVSCPRPRIYANENFSCRIAPGMDATACSFPPSLFSAYHSETKRSHIYCRLTLPRRSDK